MASCRSDLADQLKRMLTAREVVEHYGFHPDRGGFIQCPFHQGDNHGSLKIYDGNRGWHCFGCGAGGTVIDFAMRLFDLSFRQACLRLNMDFNLHLIGEKPDRKAVAAAVEQRRREERERAAIATEYQKKAAEHRYWWQVKLLYEPTKTDAEAGFIHPLFADALKRLPVLEAWLDEYMGR